MMAGENVEYTVVTGDSEENLSQQVNEMQGWTLWGGVSCALSEDENWYSQLFAQAMIRNKINSKSEEGESNE